MVTTIDRPAPSAGPRHAAAPDVAPRHEPPAAVRAVGLTLALTAALAVMFLAFAWPAAKSKPHQIPLGIVGPTPAITQVESALNTNAPDGFALTSYPDQGALRTAIRDREVYGGFVLTPEGSTVLTATGGSPAVAQSLTQIGAALSQHAGQPLRTEDLAALPSGDPRGISLAASALPLTMAAIIPAIALLFVFSGRIGWQITTLTLFAAAISATVTALLWHVFGAVDQNFWGVTVGLFAGVLATGLTILGLGNLFGKAGIGLGAGVAMLLGNPLSAINSAPELLPAGWGAVGQWLPQGANATLLRSTAYFPDAFPDPRATTALVVLAVWAGLGAVLIAIAAWRGRSHTG